MTAQIIQFPAQPDRLGSALTRLTTALAEQREALAAWRAALGELGAQVRSTESALLDHQRGLGALQDDVATLHERSMQLQAWGDRWSPATAANATT